MPQLNHRRLPGLATALTLAVGVSGLQAQSTRSPAPAPAMRTDAILRVARLRTSAVVSVHTLRQHLVPDEPSVTHVQEGLGSGVVIDTNGLILTNAHVVDGASTIHVLSPDGGDVEASVIGSDPDIDLALIRVADARGLRPAPLGDSSRLNIGEWVVAIGNPLGLHHTVTAGIVSARARTLDDSGIEYLQTDATLGPGSSGGPLLDLAGRVVGLNVGLLSTSGQNVGLNVAIPVAIVKEMLPRLQAGAPVLGWIGVTTAPFDPSRAPAQGPRRGLVLTAVTQGGPAQQAGLSAGDIVTGFADDPSLMVQDFFRHIRSRAPGAVIRLSVWRSGRRLILPVEVGRRPTRDDRQQPSVP